MTTNSSDDRTVRGDRNETGTAKDADTRVSVWAIGDVHGQLAMLESLLSALPRGENDYTVFLGDYIDRGPDSAGVVRRVLAEYDRAPERTILLWGNHEDLAAAHWNISAPSTFQYDPYDWFKNGGKQAMESYGFVGRDIFEADCPTDLRRLFSLLRTYWRPPAAQFPELAQVVYVHAGLLPGVAPEFHTGDTLLWVREDFLKATDRSGRLVVHGHTPAHDVRPESDKIGIDTGAVFGGRLTALQMPERRIFQADAGGSVTTRVLA